MKNLKEVEAMLTKPGTVMSLKSQHCIDEFVVGFNNIK